MMKKNLISLAIGSAFTLSTPIAFADLPVKAHLSMTLATPQTTSCLLDTVPPCLDTRYNVTSLVGSFFNLANSDAPIESFDGIVLGTTQPASNSHSGAPDGSEIPGIDNPWLFASNTGMHQSTSDINKIDNTSIDFSGWSVTWNGIADIPMGGDTTNFPTDTGIASISCGACGDGDAYTLDYAAHVPLNDPSNFGGSVYLLHLEGVISKVPVPAAVWLFGSGLLGLVGVARRKKQV